jgi:hypothetical protein
MKLRATLMVLLLLVSGGATAAAVARELPSYETRYYVIHTDLSPDEVREAAVRVTKMAEVYHDRTKGFSGAIRKKFPLYLYRHADDYHAAGGPVGSAGVYDGRALMAVAGDRLGQKTWRVVQHEGFHQFAMNVIRGDLPVWVNEGLAEYFGEGIFTGDDMMTGVIPNRRLARVRESIRAGRFKTLDAMMRLSLDEWNREMDATNYDQAWSMVQFLAHGDGGKYQKAFIAFMNALGRGKGKTEAWKIAFGDGRGFEDRWREHWTKLEEGSTDELYRRASVATITSFLARATAAGQSFESMQDFARAASEDQLKTNPEDTLPRSILATAMNDLGKRLNDGQTFAIEKLPDEKMPSVVSDAPGAARLVGRFRLRNGRVQRVWVE